MQFPPLLPLDKVSHYFYGTVASVVGAALAHMLTITLPHAGWLLLGASATAGALKELTDYVLNYKARKAGTLAPHEVAWADFFWTTYGAFPALVAVSVIN